MFTHGHLVAGQIGPGRCLSWQEHARPLCTPFLWARVRYWVVLCTVGFVYSRTHATYLVISTRGWSLSVQYFCSNRAIDVDQLRPSAYATHFRFENTALCTTSACYCSSCASQHGGHRPQCRTAAGEAAALPGMEQSRGTRQQNTHIRSD